MPWSCGAPPRHAGLAVAREKISTESPVMVVYMLASSVPILTDFHSNWQIGMSMLEMLCESQGNKSQNVHMRICGTHSICHNVYHHFKTCTRPQFFTSSILELLQLGFAIWSKSQLKSAIIVQIMRSIVQDMVSSQMLVNSSVLQISPGQSHGFCMLFWLLCLLS